VPSPSTPPTAADLLGQWRPDWLTLAVLLALVGWYGRLRQRAGSPSWPRHRDVLLGAGVALAAWTTSGFPAARGPQLMWVWTAQQLALLLVVPAVLLSAQPLALARAVGGGRARPLRLLATRPARLLGHPALSLLYVPLLCSLLFFWGLGDWSLRSPTTTDLLHLLLLAVGAVVALPLVDAEDGRTSLAVGAAVAIGAVELLVDAIPGIVLRLETHLQMSAFATGRPAWAPSALADQQTAGTILWTVAELLDLPFLVLAVRQWVRVERREAQRIDAELDRAELDRARAAAAPDGAPPAAPPSTSRPWWLDHPELGTRYGTPARRDDGGTPTP
jgi:putative copper resistance protein D